MNCDGIRGLLSAYLDGELSPGDLLRVEQHLRRCHWCADEVDSLRQTVALVASMDEVEVPLTFHVALHDRLVTLGPPVANVHRVASVRPHVSARRWAMPAAAAAAAAALALGISTYHTPAGPGLQENRIAQVESVTPDQPQPNVVAVHPGPPASPGSGEVTDKPQGGTTTAPSKSNDTAKPPVTDTTTPISTGNSKVAAIDNGGNTQTTTLPAKQFYTATFTVSSAVAAKAIPTVKNSYPVVEQNGGWLITVSTKSFNDAVKALEPLLGTPELEAFNLADQIKQAEEQLDKSKNVYNNYKSLFGSQPTADQAALLKNAEQDVAQKQADVDRLNLQLQTSTIYVQLQGQPAVR